MRVRFRKRERDRMAIIAEILDMARDGVLKTNIMWRARMSYNMLSGYLQLMMSNRLLDKVMLDNRVMFKTTGKGLTFLYHCQEITALLDAQDSGNKLYERIQLFPSCPPALHQHMPFSISK